jgi:hypothetical protein
VTFPHYETLIKSICFSIIPDVIFILAAYLKRQSAFEPEGQSMARDSAATMAIAIGLLIAMIAAIPHLFSL